MKQKIPSSTYSATLRNRLSIALCYLNRSDIVRDELIAMEAQHKELKAKALKLGRWSPKSKAIASFLEIDCANKACQVKRLYTAVRKVMKGKRATPELDIPEARLDKDYRKVFVARGLMKA